MKVLLLCTKVPFPAKDGGSLATMSFARMLNNAGFQVTILATNTTKHFVSNHPENVEGINLRSVAVNTGIKFRLLLANILFSKLPYNVVRFYQQGFCNYLRNLLQKDDFNIIQFEGAHMGIYLPLIHAYSKARIILRAHNVEHLIWQNLTLESSGAKKLYLKNLTSRLKLFEEKLISEVDAVVPISENDEKLIKEFSSPKKSLVIPFGIDLEKYRTQDLATENSIFFLGALDWIPNQKGLVWFINQVWVNVSRQNPQITFHIAGRNAPSWLKALFRLHKIQFYGEVSDSINFMNRFELMIVPLFSGSGLRIKIMEAMSLKKAVITTPKGAEGLNVESGRELIVAENSEAFYQAIMQFTGDKNKQKLLGETARAFISKEFDNLAFANKVISFYGQL